MASLVHLEAKACRLAIRRNLVDRIVRWTLMTIAGLVCLAVFMMVFTVIRRGLPAMSWQFLSTGPTENMSAGGIWPMIRGSLLLMAGALIASLPLGILGGIFLAEYSDRSAIIRFIRATVAALAGTPSIVFGLFGMTTFVILPRTKPSLIAGCLTIATMAIPVIVQVTENAIRRVPDTIVEAAFAVGLSRAQTIFRVVLPSAFPGIATGLILVIGRAAGEAPPIFLTAGIYYSTSKFNWNLDILRNPVENLPYHLAEGYRQGGQIPDKLIWGTCLVLVSLTLCINLLSIIYRQRLRKNWNQ